ncbi:MAG: 3-hydroxyacyl-CoA dehydrogenase/enoyl-CoA hydratase family protein [Rhodospirillaceae bacterium]
MSYRLLPVRRAAVLGAGVMGAQIAAHLVNAGIPAILFELPATEGDRSANAVRAIEGLHKLEPTPLATAEVANYIRPANYDEHLSELADCDLVIEAISERLDLKLELYARVSPHLSPTAAFVTNTSGLPIDRLAQGLPDALRSRFCGVHFFNPPRYMHLVELIPGAATDPELLDALETLLVTALGKGVVRAKDTPNFIGNRVGLFSLLTVMHHAARFGLGFDTVDALTGPLIGRPRSATFRTADVVGLDTFAHVVKTMRDGLPGDPWHAYYAVPPWMQRLIDAGALGQKTRRGIYQKIGKDIHVLDLETGEYRPAQGVVDAGVAALLKESDVETRFAQLRRSEHVQARFLWSVYRDMFHYCACHLAEIADTARDVDFVLRWGFAWERGPFETWQAAGWQPTVRAMQEELAAGKGMTDAPLPSWATDPQRSAVHTAQGSYSPQSGRYKPRSSLPVYRRQPFPETLLGVPRQFGETIFETPSVRCWHTGDDVAIVSFKTRMHTIDDGVLDGVLQAIDVAEQRYAGLVIWQTEPPFSAGANLKRRSGEGSASKPSAGAALLKRLRRTAAPLVLKAAHRLGVADQLMAGKLQDIEDLVARFQETTQALRYSMIPVVAAVDGLAIGGGCEFVMHADRTVASLESYIGLVEVGLGLVPAGGGCKEFALRAAREAHGGDLMPALQRSFRTVANGEPSRSAQHARALGYLTPADRIVMNRHEVLHVARSEARALAEAGYRPPLPPDRIPVAGRTAIATFKAYIVNLFEGGRISEHDMLVGEKLAIAMCGGDVDAGSLVDEQWLLDLERVQFMELIATEKTQARIEHMLKTGKPLRN